MGKIKELQTKLGAPTWIFIYYGVGYAFIFHDSHVDKYGCD